MKARISHLFTSFSILTLSIVFQTIYFRFHPSQPPRTSPLPPHLSHIYSLNLEEEKKKGDEIRRAPKLEWREVDAQNLRLYPLSFLRKFFLLSLKLHSLFVTVLLSVNRNFSPSAIPRPSPLGHSRFSSRAGVCTRARGSGLPSFSSLRNLPPPSSRPFSSFRSFSSLPWRPRG